MELLFEILASRRDEVLKIVQAVPSDWTYINTFLEAPESLILAGKVELNTGFSFAKHHCIHPNICSRPVPRGQDRAKPNFVALTAHRKFPGFVELDHAGERYDFTLDDARKIFYAYVELGYQWKHLDLSYWPDADDEIATLRLHWVKCSQFGDRSDSYDPHYRIKLCLRREDLEKEIASVRSVILSTSARPYEPCIN